MIFYEKVDIFNVVLVQAMMKEVIVIYYPVIVGIWQLHSEVEDINLMKYLTGTGVTTDFY